ncbi:hypothetical protein GCM10009092_33400 [Bowmanella denitrificans]|uniref:GGDEF domain-containing protein n=1 Tax=Bowmanella denitrificans TaxID=366582 RepID=A0ABN0XKC6_9ALTE
MLFQVVHTIGSSVYFVFFILFLWMSRIPRTNSGAIWWAAAIGCALLARLVLLVTQSVDSLWLPLALYAFFNMLEKLLLYTGLLRFLNLSSSTAWFWYGFILIEALMLVSWGADWSIWLFRISFAAFNVTVLLNMTWRIYQYKSPPAKSLLRICALICLLLAIHWASVYPVIYHFREWSVQGFLLGTLLVLGLYLSLLAALLQSFQRRLLDAEERALNLAYHDPLTGLRNKLYVNHLFEHAVTLANRPHQLMAVFYIDLDDFKPINDNAGHKVGDLVLKEMAKRLKSSLRSTDICARIGGDEFVVIATQLDNAEQAHGIADKILAQLLLPVKIKAHRYNLGASIGISLYPQCSIKLNELIEQADWAMYQVKREGKSGYRIFTGNQGDSQPTSS